MVALIVTYLISGDLLLDIKLEEVSVEKIVNSDVVMVLLHGVIYRSTVLKLKENRILSRVHR